MVDIMAPEIDPGIYFLVTKNIIEGKGIFNGLLFPGALAHADVDGVDYWIATDRRDPTAEQIAEVYRLRWNVENFFAWWKRMPVAAAEELTHALIKSKSVCIAYETIQKNDYSLPLLTPMSEVAGRMAIQQGAKYLEMAQGGHGVLLGGVPGVDPGNVVVIGGGIVGVNAAKMACGLGAKVYILDMNLDRLRYLSDVMPANCFNLFSSPATLRELIANADVVVGAVLIPGAKAPKLITRDMLKIMKPGSVLVDVAIDQGGCFETSKATTHGDPIYVVDGVVHYCVANMPGAVPRTSTMALTNATLPYAVEIANKGWKKAMQESDEIKLGANVINGKITYQAIAEAFDLEHIAIDTLL